MEDFFKEYTEAFDTFDAISIARLYSIPCAISDGDGEQVYSESNELISKFSSNCDAMRSMAYKYAKFNILGEQDLGQSAKAVTVGWRIYLENSEIEFRTLYVCHFINGLWQIFTAKVYQGSLTNNT